MNSQECWQGFDITAAQYHAGLDKLWAAMGLAGVQKDDAFTLAASEIAKLQAEVRLANENALMWRHAYQGALLDLEAKLAKVMKFDHPAAVAGRVHPGGRPGPAEA